MRWNRCYWVIFKLKLLMFYVTGIAVGYHGEVPDRQPERFVASGTLVPICETGLAYRSPNGSTKHSVRSERCPVTGSTGVHTLWIHV